MLTYKNKDMYDRYHTTLILPQIDNKLAPFKGSSVIQ